MKRYVWFIVVFVAGFHLGQAQEISFETQSVYQSDNTIFSLSHGNLDTSGTSEIVLLTPPRDVLILDPTDWSAETIYSSTHEIRSIASRPTIEVGDIMDTAGNEIVFCAMPFVSALYQANGQWNHSFVYDKRGMVGDLWGARIGDYDSNREGLEIFVIDETVLDFSIAAALHQATEPGTWNEIPVYQGEVGMDSAAGEFDPNHEESELVITTEMGPTYKIIPPENDAQNEWPKETIWDVFDDSGWVVQVGDVYPLHEGNELVYGSRYNNKIHISYETENDQHTLETIFQGITQEDPRNMYDIAVSDILPENPGDEIVGVDRSGAVYLVWYNDGWNNQLIWQDDAPLYAVIIGEFDSTSYGLEILVGGESQTLTMIRRETSSLSPSWSYY